jgi:hypothetical protein
MKQQNVVWLMTGTYILDLAADVHGLVHTPAYISSIRSITGDHMTFVERLKNSIQYFVLTCVYYVVGPFVDEDDM